MAGLLTFGSSYLLRLPIHLIMRSKSQNEQWHGAAFVPDYSGGSVPDFHRFPYYALLKHHQVIHFFDSI
jgi:hypothetical protein